MLYNSSVLKGVVYIKFDLMTIWRQDDYNNPLYSVLISIKQDFRHTPGVFSYLILKGENYMDFILLIVGFILLIKCADMFVEGCSNLAKFFGVSTLIIGLTIVAFGTSAPEAAVSLIASINGNNDITMGNIVGSNIANLLLILGASGLFAPLVAKKKIIYRDYVYSLLTYLVLFIMAAGYFFAGAKTAIVTRTDGCLLLCFLAIYLYSLLVDARKSARESKAEKAEGKKKFELKNIPFMIFGIIGIIVGGRFVVDSATNIATFLGVSQTVIGLTIVAVGTSLPELVTSIVAVRKGETDMAIGNILGSNIFNILFILGLTSIVSPVSFAFVSFIDIIIMSLAGIVVFFFILKNYRIGRLKGVIMIVMYVLYNVYILIR